MILLISTCKYKLHEEEFIQPVADILSEPYKAIHHTKIKPEHLQNASRVIICGTALKDFEYLKTDWSWVLSYSKPLLGICAGAQVIAREYSSTETEEKKIGAITVHGKKMYALHTLTFNVPLGFSGTKYEFKKGNTECYLYHPEVLNKEIIKAFEQK